eukprot:COSAG01_NODE_7904_length_2999_cov_2.253793_5_plen_61_part_01
MAGSEAFHSGTQQGQGPLDPQRTGRAIATADSAVRMPICQSALDRLISSALRGFLVGGPPS